MTFDSPIIDYAKANKKLTGCQVYAIMKWISCSLPADEQIKIMNIYLQYPDNFNLSSCNTLPHAAKLSNYYSRYHLLFDNSVSSTANARFRRYIMERINIPEKNLPLILHSTALVDAFSYHSCFLSWKMYCAKKKNKLNRDRILKIKYFVWRWRKVYDRRIILAYQAQEVTERSNAILQYNVLREWILLFKSSYYLRMVTLRNRTVQSWVRWCELNNYAKSRRIAYCNVETETIINYYRGDSFGNWKNVINSAADRFRNLKLLRKAVTRLLLRASYSESMRIRTIQKNSKHPFFKVLRRNFYEFHSYYRKRKVIYKWRNVMASLYNRRCQEYVLDRLATPHYFIRQVSAAFNYWRYMFRYYALIGRIGRRCNRKSKTNIIYNCFFAWRYLFQRRELMKKHKCEELGKLMVVMQEKAVSWGADITDRKSIIRVWAKIVRNRKIARIFIRIFRHFHLSAVLSQWKKVDLVDKMTIRIQKSWRGYVCRLKGTARDAVQHLQQYGDITKQIVSQIRPKYLMKLGFGMLKKLVLSNHAQRDLFVRRKALHRGWFGLLKFRICLMNQHSCLALAERRFYWKNGEKIIEYLNKNARNRVSQYNSIERAGGWRYQFMIKFGFKKLISRLRALKLQNKNLLRLAKEFHKNKSYKETIQENSQWRKQTFRRLTSIYPTVIVTARAVRKLQLWVKRSRLGRHIQRKIAGGMEKKLIFKRYMRQWKETVLFMLSIRIRSNKCRLLHYSNILSKIMFRWKVQYSRRLAIKNANIARINEAGKVLSVKKVEWDDSRLIKYSAQVFRAWAKAVKCRYLLRLSAHKLARNAVFKSFQHWNEVNIVHKIVVYLQKMWRGYFVRFVNPKTKSLYRFLLRMRPISRRIRHIIRRKALLRFGFRILKEALHAAVSKNEKQSCLRVAFKRLCNKRLKHCASQINSRSAVLRMENYKIWRIMKVWRRAMNATVKYERSVGLGDLHFRHRYLTLALFLLKDSWKFSKAYRFRLLKKSKLFHERVHKKRLFKYWYRTFSYRKKFMKIYRAFYLRSSMSIWSRAANFMLLERSKEKFVSHQRRLNVLHSVWKTWQITAEKYRFLRFSKEEVEFRKNARLKVSSFHSWMIALVNSRDDNLIRTITKKHRIYCLKRHLRCWKQAMIVKSHAEIQLRKRIFEYWRDKFCQFSKNKVNNLAKAAESNVHRLCKMGFKRIQLRNKQVYLTLQLSMQAEACILLNKLRNTIRYWQKWACIWMSLSWGARKHRKNLENDSFKNYSGTLNSFSAVKKRLFTEKESSVIVQKKFTKFEPDGYYQAVKLRYALNLLYKFMKIRQRRKRNALPIKCMKAWKLYSRKNRFRRLAFIQRFGSLLANLQRSFCFFLWQKFLAKKKFNSRAVKIVVANSLEKPKFFNIWKKKYVRRMIVKKTINKMFSCILRHNRQVYQKLLKLAFKQWYIRISEYDERIIGSFTRRIFFKRWRVAYSVALEKNKKAAKKALRAWRQYVCVYIAKKRNRAMSLRWVGVLMESKLQHHFQHMLAKYFEVWLKNIRQIAPIKAPILKSPKKDKSQLSWKNQINTIRSNKKLTASLPSLSIVGRK